MKLASSGVDHAARHFLSLIERLARRLLHRPRLPAVIATHPFDARYGTDTSGIINRRKLRSGHAHDAFITAYFGVPPSRFVHAIARWRTTSAAASPELYRFIDIGCGKGRALLLASLMPFRDVVGIELNEALATAARANLNRWCAQTRPVASVTILHADAPSAIQDLLDGPTLLYLYNPFEAPVLRALLAAIINRHPPSSPVDILYLFPAHEAVFGDFPQFHKLWHEPIRLDAEDEGDGMSAATDPCSLYRLQSGWGGG